MEVEIGVLQVSNEGSGSRKIPFLILSLGTNVNKSRRGKNLFSPCLLIILELAGPLSLTPADALNGFLPLDNPSTLHEASRFLVAQFDEAGLGFPIRALLVGPAVLGELSLNGRQARSANTT